MNTSSIHSLSQSFLQSMLGAAKPSSSSAGSPQASLFAEMLKGSSSAGSASANAKTATPSANQLLTQVMPSYQANGVQNEAQSLDPLSIV